MKHLTRFLCIGLLAMAFAACEKDPDPVNPDPVNPDPVNPDPVDPDPVDPATTFALLLNEGSDNNAAISYLNTTTGEIDNAWFQNANGRSLGSNAQDMVAYGSKVYVTVTESNSLEVIDPTTGKSQRVDMHGRKPRHIATHNGNLYITCYDKSVACIDTATLSLVATCPLGNFRPEGIAIANGKAFVASSWELNGNYTVYDSTLYVIDLTTFSNPTAITVGMNLQRVYKLDENHIILTWTGNYGDIPAGTAIIDATTLDITPTSKPLSKLVVYNGMLYGYATEYDENYNETATFRVIDATGVAQSFPFTPVISNNAYGFNIDPNTGNIYITSSDYMTNGDLYSFTPSGSLRFKVETAMNPSTMLFF